VPENPNDPDILLCTLHASFAKALDYNPADDAKGKDIAAKRYEFRDYLGTSYYREVNLKPLP
jgi:hypothetical protein